MGEESLNINFINIYNQFNIYPHLEMLLKADIWHHIILLQVHQRNVGKQNIGLDLKALQEFN